MDDLGSVVAVALGISREGEYTPPYDDLPRIPNFSVVWNLAFKNFTMKITRGAD